MNGEEVIYTGIVTNLKANPGNERVQLTWNPSSDPSITKYVIYYNSRRDSWLYRLMAKQRHRY
ncbi:DUF4998 domain-containing protein [Niabella hibiscisoli]|nr:DUF4998 domain-containing protein [Niabella hibiscisoli]